MEYVVAVVMLALLQYTWFGIEVGRARGRFEVPAPATTGHENFERFFRAHQNTTEQLVVFLPATFACAYLVNETLAAAMGLLFVIGRLMYFRGYTNPEKSRSLGFGLGLIANTVMILATLYQVGIAATG
jgi:glutathione S-transferase